MHGLASGPNPPIAARPTDANARTVGRAFTLIEIIVVMLVVSILAVAAMPSMSSIGRVRAAAAARQIARDLSYARERAMAMGSNTWVVFSVAGDSYSVLQENPASPGRVGATTITDPATQQPMLQRLAINESAGVDITAAAFGNGSEVGFDRLGRPLLTNGALMNGTGSVTLRGGHQATVQATTGRVGYVAGTGG